MFLPPVIITLLANFQPAFTSPSYRKMLVLMTGTLLSRGRHTITAALKQLGLQNQKDWSKYHHLFNRAHWSALALSRILLALLIKTFPGADQTLDLVVDETLERRWGKKLTRRCHWRDSLLSSHSLNVTNSGLKWVVLTLVVKLPWSPSRWALPFLTTSVLTPKVSQELGLLHKTGPRLAGQMVRVVRRWFPNHSIKLIGDRAYSVIELGNLCRKLKVTLIAPLRLDARLFEPPPLEKAPTGRPRIVGKRLPNLSEKLTDPKTEWLQEPLEWYGGKLKILELATGLGWWYSSGFEPLPIRWVLVKDPEGKLPSRAYFSTDLQQLASSIVADMVKRWPIEVMFEESRAHLGIETQRQWSDKATARTTPMLLGLFSLTVLMAQTLYPNGEIPLAQAAWYTKSHASFSDILAVVRRAVWGDFSFKTCHCEPEMVLVPKTELLKLAYAVCY